MGGPSQEERERLVAAHRGASIVRWIVLQFVVGSAIVIVNYNLVVGQDRLPTQLVRFGLTLFLCWALYRGKGWARGVCMVLFGLAGLAMAYRAVTSSSTLAAMVAAIYLGSVYFLALSPDVRAYFLRRQTDLLR